MRHLRRILKIGRDNVREQRIGKSHVRKRSLNIETIENIIAKRRLIFVGKIIRIPRRCVLTKLFSTFQREKRLLGRTNFTVRHSFINDIEKNDL